MRGRRRASVARAISQSIGGIHSRILAVDWLKVFRASFMLLFVAYPGVALKIMRMFRCNTIEDEAWLAVDMRLRCYTEEWFGYVHVSV